MNPVLLLPAALAALAALAVPLLLHLARRQQQRPTTFAALRWLRAAPKPRRRIRFDEWPLLVVRLLLVALLALLLARPALLGVEDTQPRLLVVPGVDPSAIEAAAVEGVDARWLAPGFPSLRQPAPSGTFPTASLLREFDATLPAEAPLTVLVPERMAGADAERLRLAHDVDWRVVAASNASPAVTRRPAPRMAIRTDAAHGDGARFLRAAALSWQDDDAKVDAVSIAEDASTPLPPGTTVLAWLRPEALPPALQQWVEQCGTALLAADAEAPTPAATSVVWRDDAGQSLLSARAAGKGRILRFEHTLEPRAMPQLFDASFARRLREVLQPPQAPTLVLAEEYVPAKGAVASPPMPRDLRPWLALAIALLALLERWLATSRRRGVVA